MSVNCLFVGTTILLSFLNLKNSSSVLISLLFGIFEMSISSLGLLISAWSVFDLSLETTDLVKQ